MTDSTEIERWFRQRGFTSLLDGTSMTPRPGLYAKALAALLVVSLLVLAPIEATNSAATFAVNVVLVAAAWFGLNVAARRPLMAPPRDVTWRERTVFVLLPALSMLVTPSAELSSEGFTLSPVAVSLISAAGTALGGLVLLWVVSLVVKSGLLSVFPWLARQVARAFLSSGGVLGRTIPLLLGVVALIYFTAEIWQSIGRLASWGYLLVLLFFAGLSWIFLHSRENLDLESLATFHDVESVAAPLADTPLATLAIDPVDLPARTPLGRAQESDLRLVATLSRVTVVTVISLAVFAFFMVLGLTAINAEVVKLWLGSGDPQVLWTLETSRHRYDLTIEHIRVAGFLAVFSGFYFAVVSRTDQGLRESIHDTAEDAIREACAARMVVLHHYPQRVDAADR